MIEDKLLVWRFNRGDAAALCRICEKYRDDLLKVAAALLSDRSGVEDVLHDVFTAFAQNTGRLELKGSLKGYLAICVANRARDRNRMQRRRGAADLEQVRPERPAVAGPEHNAIGQEMAAKLDAAMAGLPDEQREAVVLHLQSKMRFRDIARLRGISINTALSRYRYGLEKLRSSLNGEMEP
ncbi:MAG: sigma-70 family RNA polymerase sigma factor [Sedimentisphaerales bacterium]|nr:sigma-70 family RNA polymerase sigma factor [Sedimentisphaerales bacterium]